MMQGGRGTRRKLMGTGRRSWRRAAVLMAYGGRCACCFEERLELLTFDHIGGWGGEHRKLHGPAEVQRWISLHGTPDAIQILCMNCNWARGQWGYCPHEREGRAEWKFTRFGWVGPDGLDPLLVSARAKRSKKRRGARRAADSYDFDLDRFFEQATGQGTCRLTKPCACGCGEMKPAFNLDGTPNMSKFKPGHNYRSIRNKA